MKLNEASKKFQNYKNIYFNKTHFIIALVHIIISISLESSVFTDIQKIWIYKKYWILRIVAGIITIFMWQIVGFVVKKVKEKDKDVILYLKYFSIYFFSMLFILIIIWPGEVSNTDIYNFFNATKKMVFHYRLNYVTSCIYIVSSMIIPIISASVIALVLFSSLTVAYILYSTNKLFNGSKISNYMFIPFFMFSVLINNVFPDRVQFFSIFYLLLLSDILFVKLLNKELSNFRVILWACLTGILAQWRSEGMILLIAVPIFIYIFYSKTTTIKLLMLRSFILIIMSFAIVSLPQKVYESGLDDTSFNSNNNRNLPTIVSPLIDILKDKDAKALDNEKLEKIDKVVSVEILRDTPARMDDVNALWLDGCLRKYNQEEYDDFKATCKDLFVANYDIYIKSKAKLFLSASGIKNRGILCSCNIFEIERWTKFQQKTLMFNNKIPNLRKVVISALECHRYNHWKENTWLSAIMYNILIPVFGVIIIFFGAIKKRNMYFFICAGMILAQTLALFLTAPTNYFKYYLSIFMFSWFLIMLFILSAIYNKTTNDKVQLYKETK